MNNKNCRLCGGPSAAEFRINGTFSDSLQKQILDSTKIVQHICIGCRNRIEKYYEFKRKGYISDGPVEDSTGRNNERNVKKITTTRCTSAHQQNKQPEKAGRRYTRQQATEFKKRNEKREPPRNDTTRCRQLEFSSERGVSMQEDTGDALDQSCSQNTGASIEFEDNDTVGFDDIDPNIFRSSVPGLQETTLETNERPSTSKDHDIPHLGARRLFEATRRVIQDGGLVDLKVLKIRGSYVCPFCFKNFGTAPSLSNHFLLHNGIKGLFCEICKKKFWSKKSWAKHKCDSRRKDPAHECEFCHQCYTSPSALKSHVKDSHLKKQFKCLTCGEHFSFHYKLRRHLLTKHKTKLG